MTTRRHAGWLAVLVQAQFAAQIRCGTGAGEGNGGLM